jgi:ribosomal protein S3AE
MLKKCQQDAFKRKHWNTCMAKNVLNSSNIATGNSQQPLQTGVRNLSIGLIEGYSSEREALNQQISDLEEKKEALVLELETTKNKLQDLESIHHEAVSRE